MNGAPESGGSFFICLKTESVQARQGGDSIRYKTCKTQGNFM